MPYCQNCGSIYQEGCKFCQNCGHKLDTIPTAPQGTEASISNAERWDGAYTYNRSKGFFGSLFGPRSPVEFSAILVFEDDTLFGKIKEINTFPEVEDEYAPRYLFAKVKGYINGDEIVFVKKYDGSGGYWHSINYKGKLDSKNGRISGTWAISRSNTGEFEMSRIARVLATGYDLW